MARDPGWDAFGSTRAPLPDQGLKKGAFLTGAPAERFKGGRPFAVENAIWGR